MYRFDLALPLHAREATYLLGHHLALEFSLMRDAHMLEVAPPADGRYRAGLRDAIGAGPGDGHGVTKRVSSREPGDADVHDLALESVPDEDDASVVAGHPVPTVGDRSNLDSVQEVADPPWRVTHLGWTPSAPCPCPGAARPPVRDGPRGRWRIEKRPTGTGRRR